MRSFVSVAAIILILAGAANAELPSASSTTVNQALLSGKPTLIDFGLRTCTVCKKMAPYLESLSNDYRGQANVLFIDVRSDQATAQKFRVQMLPTQIFINPQGKEVQRHTGFMDKEGIIKGLKSAGLK
jgi:thioredoxin 1